MLDSTRVLYAYTLIPTLSMTDLYSTNNTEVFVYTEGAALPRDVVHVRVHPSVTIIPENAFYQCHQMRSVELSEGLLEIGGAAFMKCETLKQISIPSTVTRILQSSFYGCTSLEKVTLHDGLLAIGKKAFFGCKSLKRIYVPNTVIDWN